MFQSWRDLFFLHWACDPQWIQTTLPESLQVDTFEGQSYIGMVAFRVCNLRLAFIPPLPGISHFFEVNLRTYVVNEKKQKGVWFYSLDANSYLAVKAARYVYKLPYFFSDITFELQNQKAQIQVKRKNTGLISRFCLIFESEFHKAKGNTLEHFLIERYRLFTTDAKGNLYTLNVCHSPYLLAPTQLVNFDKDLLTIKNLNIDLGTIASLLYSPGVDVNISQLHSAAARTGSDRSKIFF